MYIDYKKEAAHELHLQGLERKVLKAAEHLFITLKAEQIEVTSSLPVAKALTKLFSAVTNLQEFE